MSQILTFETVMFVQNPNHIHGDKRLESENAVAEEIAVAIKGILQANGMLLVGGKTCARYPTYQEQLEVVPRKVHMKFDGKQICNTPYVSAKNLTDKEPEVTCKLCRRVLEEDDS